MNTILRVAMIEMTADADPNKNWKSCWVDVISSGSKTVEPRWKACLPQFRMMCDAIMSDIHNPAGSGKGTITAICRVEQRQSELEELGGNAWYTYITRDKVWFEGQYSQGEGGEVSLTQFKLAVQTYLQFLEDPEHKPIELDFPEH